MHLSLLWHTIQMVDKEDLLNKTYRLLLQLKGEIANRNSKGEQSTEIKPATELCVVSSYEPLPRARTCPNPPNRNYHRYQRITEKMQFEKLPMDMPKGEMLDHAAGVELWDSKTIIFVGLGIKNHQDSGVVTFWDPKTATANSKPSFDYTIHTIAVASKYAFVALSNQQIYIQQKDTGESLQLQDKVKSSVNCSGGLNCSRHLYAFGDQVYFITEKKTLVHYDLTKYSTKRSLKANVDAWPPQRYSTAPLKESNDFFVGTKFVYISDAKQLCKFRRNKLEFSLSVAQVKITCLAGNDSEVMTAGDTVFSIYNGSLELKDSLAMKSNCGAHRLRMFRYKGLSIAMGYSSDFTLEVFSAFRFKLKPLFQERLVDQTRSLGGVFDEAHGVLYLVGEKQLYCRVKIF